MSDRSVDEARHARMAKAIRKVINRRERAPRSPRMARAMKRMIWRYSRVIQAEHAERLEDPEKGSGQDA